MATTPQPSSLVLPSAFPDALFEAIATRVVQKMKNPSPELDNFGGAQNGVRYRLRACADYAAEFTESIRRVGAAPPGIERYQQERQLFGFFVSGAAVLDSFSFFLYFAAAQLQPTCFPTQPRDITQIDVNSASGKFKNAFPGEMITSNLTNLVDDPNFKEWRKCRNILAHRAAPGRVIYASVGSNSVDLAADWRIDSFGKIKIDVNLTPPRLEWLLKTLAGLVEAADQFTQKHFEGSQSRAPDSLLRCAIPTQ